MMEVYKLLSRLKFSVRWLWLACVVNFLVYLFLFNDQFVELFQNPVRIPNKTNLTAARAFDSMQVLRTVLIDSYIPEMNRTKALNVLSFIPSPSQHVPQIKSPRNNVYLTHSFKVHSSPRYVSRILNKKTAQKSLAFSPAMTSKERRILQDILLKCVKELERAGITYFMYSGTLLGSYRHHDVIPWDDDVDFIVNYKQRTQFYLIFSELRPFFFLNIYSNVRWKLFSIQSRPVKILPWSWPFLDISFYQENSTHIWDCDEKFSKHYTYKKSDIFPLTKRPYMGMLLPAPRNTKTVLEFYKPELCRSVNYNHRKEKEIHHIYNVKCEYLIDRYPMVTRQSVLHGINETLVFRGKVLKWFFTRNV